MSFFCFLVLLPICEKTCISVQSEQERSRVSIIHFLDVFQLILQLFKKLHVFCACLSIFVQYITALK